MITVAFFLNADAQIGVPIADLRVSVFQPAEALRYGSVLNSGPVFRVIDFDDCGCGLSLAARDRRTTK